MNGNPGKFCFAAMLDSWKLPFQHLADTKDWNASLSWRNLVPLGIDDFGFGFRPQRPPTKCSFRPTTQAVNVEVVDIEVGSWDSTLAPTEISEPSDLYPKFEATWSSSSTRSLRKLGHLNGDRDVSGSTVIQNTLKIVGTQKQKRLQEKHIFETCCNVLFNMSQLLTNCSS